MLINTFKLAMHLNASLKNESSTFNCCESYYAHSENV